jgi:hypothetical protein
MRRLPSFLVAAAVAATALRAAHAGDGVPETITGDKYALLIAVSDYDEASSGLRKLRYPRGDVDVLRSTLVEIGYEPQKIVVMDEKSKASFLPEKSKILARLDEMVSLLEKEDSILVAFAGHGVQFKDADPEASPHYFCPLDARVHDRDSLLDLREVYRRLEANEKAALRLLVVDACRNDPTIESDRALPTKSVESWTRPPEPPRGVYALYSCAPGERSYENPDLKHGVFMNYFVEGLRGHADRDEDGRVSLDELVGYTKSNTKTFVTVNRMGDKRQNPQFMGKGTTGVDWFLRNKGVKKPKKSLQDEEADKGRGADGVKPPTKTPPTIPPSLPPTSQPKAPPTTGTPPTSLPGTPPSQPPPQPALPPRPAFSPSIAFATPQNNAMASSPVYVSGRVLQWWPGYRLAPKLNGQPIQIAIDAAGNFAASIPMSRGRNLLRVEVFDDQGNHRHANRVVIVP